MRFKRVNYKHNYEIEMKHLLLSMVSISPCRIPDDLTYYQTECVCECIELGYIIGIKYERTADGIPHFQEVKPFVTLAGRDFIQAKNKNFRANLAIIISILALLVPLLAYIQDIFCNVKRLLSYVI